MRQLCAAMTIVLWLSVNAYGAEERPHGPRLSLRKPDASTPAEKAKGEASAAKPDASTKSPAPTEAARPATAPQGRLVPYVPPTASDHRTTRAVLRLKNTPANDLAATILELFRTEHQPSPMESARPLVIVPNAVSNSLVVSGPPEAIGEVQRLVNDLDHAPSMVRIELVLGDVPAAKDDPEATKAQDPNPDEIRQKMEHVSRVELTTLDNQPAEIHLGAREARVTSTQMTQFGQISSVTYENVGTIITLTPRTSGDGAVALQLNIEESHAAPAGEGTVIATPKQGEPTRVANTLMFQLQTTLRIANGQTVAVGGTSHSKSGSQRWLLVTARAVAPTTAAK